ncbi:MAG TPA: hypothetical protein PKA00_11790 [Saprospiraceae bacterium]|nr:hypothetical protein [Saprospiraceae bacterium]HMQ83586.1 hypothetical protein [Saprospiraceae bacterium]
MNKNSGILSLVGFILAGLGFLAIMLSMIGVQFSFLLWLNQLGQLWSFLIKVLMVIAGIILVYIAQSDFSGED